MPASSDDASAILGIELQDIEPLIWRRFSVPASMSLGTVRALKASLEIHRPAANPFLNVLGGGFPIVGDLQTAWLGQRFS